VSPAIEARTISRVSVGHGLPPLAARGPITGEAILSPQQPGFRDERNLPGVQAPMDAHRLGHILDGHGKVHARAKGSLTTCKRSVTRYDYFQVASREVV